ncbi:cell wall-binding repeat-containing protein [Parageobacillus thermantarcticus]|uniref:cell wall-binding repeat-containing protein n=1 Tax=Parageobacillus thermantarcticus TaxID=186116 RepID=UPI003CC60CAB
MSKLFRGLLVAVLPVFITIGCNNQNNGQMDRDSKGMQRANMNHENMGMSTNGKNNEMEFAKPPSSFNRLANQHIMITATKNVTRINTDDPIELSVKVSQTVWPATHKENQPGGVILVPVENWQIALASVDFIHHPNNGPVLFTKDQKIPDAVIKEINRLQPLGTADGTQIMVMGNLKKSELNKLKNFKLKQISETDPAAFAKEIDRFYSDIAGKTPQGVIIGSLEEKAKLYTLIAANWIAHMEEPLLYVTENDIPQPTKVALQQRKGKANIYLLGPESVISKKVENELKSFGSVVRIAGETPVQQSVSFAAYKDEKTKFGWGLNDPGHGVSFISTKTPELAIAAAPFSHLGKHAPLIWLENGTLTKDVYAFLARLKPTFTDDPTAGPYNHAFLSGTFRSISYQTQGIIDEKLEIVPATGKGH